MTRQLKAATSTRHFASRIGLVGDDETVELRFGEQLDTRILAWRISSEDRSSSRA